jgi:hypothetical protein
MDHDFNELDNDGVVDGNALNFRSLVDKISVRTILPVEAEGLFPLPGFDGGIRCGSAEGYPGR